MPDADDDRQLPIGLRGGAYLLGVVAVACCLRLLIFAAEDAAVTSEHFAWLAVCVISAVFSAACAVGAALEGRDPAQGD